VPIECATADQRRALPFLAQRVELVVVGERLHLELVLEGQQLRDLVAVVELRERPGDGLPPAGVVIANAMHNEDDVFSHRALLPADTLARS
jgi:hypothetical protein